MAELENQKVEIAVSDLSKFRQANCNIITHNQPGGGR